MGLVFNNGSLLFSNGSLAMSANCCCNLCEGDIIYGAHILLPSIDAQRILDNPDFAEVFGLKELGVKMRVVSRSYGPGVDPPYCQYVFLAYTVCLNALVGAEAFQEALNDYIAAWGIELGGSIVFEGGQTTLGPGSLTTAQILAAAKAFPPAWDGAGLGTCGTFEPGPYGDIDIPEVFEILLENNGLVCPC